MNLPKRGNPARRNHRASAARSAAGRPARTTNGAATADTSGTRSTREESAQLVSNNGRRRSVFLVAAGRRTLAVVRGVSEFPTEADRVGLESETLLHMPETSISAVGSQYKQLSPIADDVLTNCAISQRRLRKLTSVPYFSAILLASVAGLLNPLGIQLLWQSALPATAGGQSGLLWLQYYIPRGTEPTRKPGQLARSYVWIGVAAVLGVVYVVVLGRGVTLHR